MRRYFTTLLFLMCNLFGFAQVIVNPVYDRTSYEVLYPHVDKIDLKKDTTKVYCSINYQESWSYSIPKMMFIEDLKNHKKYQITECIGLPFEPEERVFNYGGTFQFIFCFPHIDGLQKFNMIEDTSKDGFFNIYGIDISKCYPQVFEENEYKRFKNMSDFYKSSGDINKFVEFEEKELSAAQYIYGMHSLAADACYIQLAHYYNEIGDYNKAINLGERSLECDSIHIGVENKEYPVYANTLGSLSQFYLNAGKDDESLKCVQKSIRIRRNLEDEKGLLNTLYNLLLTGHDNDGIIKRIAMVKKEMESLPHFIETVSLPIARLYKIIAVNYSLINDNIKAIEYCNKAISIMNKMKHDNIEDYAELLGLKCKYQQRSELKDDAIVSGEAAKRLYESLNIRSLKYAEYLGDLAWAYGLDLNYEKSIQLQTIAAGIYQDAKDWISLAEVYGSISHYYQSAEKLVNAEQYIKKAIDVLNKHNNAEVYIIDAVEQTGNSMINNSFSLESIKQRIDTNKSNYLQTLARIYQKQGKYINAIKTELESGKILKNMGDSQMYALHLTSLSEFYMKNRQSDAAIACLEESIQILADDKRFGTAIPMLQLGLIYFQIGDMTNAVRYAKKSVSSFKSHNNHNGWISAQSLLSIFLWKNRKYDNAEQFMSEVLDFLKKFIINELSGMTMEQKQRLWDKYEYNFLLYRNIIEKSNRNATLLSKLYDHVLFSKSLLLDTEILAGKDEKSRLSISWKDIQKELSHQDIAIEFISTNDEKEGYCTYHALIIDKDCNSPKMITLISETALEKKKETDSRHVQDIVGELLWKPILNKFSKVKNIYFSPDGILHLLPIEYYKVDSIGTMFDSYNMFRLSSTKELVGRYNLRESNSAALYGGLDYSPFISDSINTYLTSNFDIMRGIFKRGGFEPLYNTYEEVQEINVQLKRKNISTTVYSSIDGTETCFKNLSNKSVNIIHLATHGMYVAPSDINEKIQNDNFHFLEFFSNEKDPVKEDIELTHSFLVMSGGNSYMQRHCTSVERDDGILTAKEISKIDLHGLDLVVLSACESAQGDVRNGGVYGLQRGFKKAGANTILMSLNKVDDEATRILMVEFYRNLMSGKTKRQSLQEAQQYLRKVDNRKFDDPKYWASFIMLDGLN